MSKPTGKLAFAYQTIANLEGRIDELMRKNAALAAEVERLSAVQGEPVAWLVRERLFCGDVTTDKDSAYFCEQLTPGSTTPLYTRPSPSVSALVEASLEVTGRSDFPGYVICAEINGYGATLGDKLYTAPQPAEQQPAADGSLTPVPDELFAAEFSAWWERHGQLCRAGGGEYERTFAFEAWRHLYPQLMILRAKPAPDVSALVEALEDISGTHHHSASAGEYFAKVAREALAAHRKWGEA